ncbi:PREDICTED: spindle and kinetochore-associated protein 2-like [Cyprinodon variegatus]|uniref:spindle and kinetochore-associated protein 2-like n=1 Tax=Cyprinodon variegatus TaxID=28743 RepID=UPI000742566A|nr:PREDICTED: spindle and kinetochore-associated protein 2-like [Cyprinodon variegatus]
MEPTVERLETMVLKSEADLDYIAKRLKLDLINHAAKEGCSSENNVMGMLENLRYIKEKHSLLRDQISKITDAQKESMETIRKRQSRAMELLKECQEASDLKAESFEGLGQESSMFLDWSEHS